MGAWIEIPNESVYHEVEQVAPLVGAWIEIILMTSVAWVCTVAPLVGAWIEIYLVQVIQLRGRGRSPRGSVD